MEFIYVQGPKSEECKVVDECPKADEPIYTAVGNALLGHYRHHKTTDGYVLAIWVPVQS